MKKPNFSRVIFLLFAVFIANHAVVAEAFSQRGAIRTRDYLLFLNDAVEGDSCRFYDGKMETDFSGGYLKRMGDPGCYRYVATELKENTLVTFLSAQDVATYYSWSKNMSLDQCLSWYGSRVDKQLKSNLPNMLIIENCESNMEFCKSSIERPEAFKIIAAAATVCVLSGGIVIGRDRLNASREHALQAADGGKVLDRQNSPHHEGFVLVEEKGPHNPDPFEGPLDDKFEGVKDLNNLTEPPLAPFRKFLTTHKNAIVTKLKTEANGTISLEGEEIYQDVFVRAAQIILGKPETSVAFFDTMLEKEYGEEYAHKGFSPARRQEALTNGLSDAIIFDVLIGIFREKLNDLVVEEAEIQKEGNKIKRTEAVMKELQDLLKDCPQASRSSVPSVRQTASEQVGSLIFQGTDVYRYFSSSTLWFQRALFLLQHVGYL